MRKINVILVLIILILLLDYIVFGGLYLIGIGNGIFKELAITMLILTVIYAIVSLAITYKAEKIGFKTNARYNKDNRAFWNRRVSGVLILDSALVHGYSMFEEEVTKH